MDASHADFVDHCRRLRPVLFVVLGSGQGVIARRIADAVSVPFGEVPGMPSATVPGHNGRFTAGSLGRLPVLVSEGRVHGYEGHDDVTRPVRFVAELGVRLALFTNAAGGIRDDLGPGVFMPINAHQDWRGHAFPPPPPRSPYCPELLGLIVSEGGGMWPGAYFAVSGPSYETPAEIRALRRAGADTVGMSTCPEVEEAAALGMRCAGLSLITNRAAGLSDGALDHHEVLAVARRSSEAMADLVERVAARIGRMASSLGGESR
jgi:purine-nucleoside phosphorylase